MTDDLLAEFLSEGRELVQSAAGDLLALERGTADGQTIDRAFRAVHTLKGSAGLFDFAPMGNTLHAAEDLLDALRAGRLQSQQTAAGPLLDCIAATERWFAAIARTGILPQGAQDEAAGLVAALHASLPRQMPPHASANMPHSPPGTPAGGAAAEPAWLPPFLAAHAAAQASLSAGGTAFRYSPAPDCFFLGDDPLATVRAIPDLVALDIAPGAAWPRPFDLSICNLVITGLSRAPETTVRDKFRFVADQAVTSPVPAATATPAPAAPDPDTIDAAMLGAPALGPPAFGTDEPVRSLRVDAARIDAMAALVGELIVAKNSLAHTVAQLGGADPALVPTFVRALGDSRADIDRLTAGLHRAVMSARMTKLARIFRRLPLAVRDIAASLGKTVHFTTEGEEIEADRTIVDGLFEPLLHVLRNALDHGIERPTRRQAAGKPGDGAIRLAATAEAGSIVVTITDDGAGIDAAKIRAAAAARGIAGAGALPPEELLFAPGFSTANAVTAISGRGVGMDAVRAAVAALGGAVSLTSAQGRGTTVRLTLPQSVVIDTVVVVHAAGERFGIPLGAVHETVLLAPGAVQALLGGNVFVFRGHAMPLLRLSALLNLADRLGAPPLKVLIVTHQGTRIGLAVDAVGERIDVLVRPLEGLLAGLSGVQGTALLGDGGVLLVLNLAALLP